MSSRGQTLGTFSVPTRRQTFGGELSSKSWRGEDGLFRTKYIPRQLSWLWGDRWRKDNWAQVPSTCPLEKPSPFPFVNQTGMLSSFTIGRLVPAYFRLWCHGAWNRSFRCYFSTTAECISWRTAEKTEKIPCLLSWRVAVRDIFDTPDKLEGLFAIGQPECKLPNCIAAFISFQWTFLSNHPIHPREPF